MLPDHAPLATQVPVKLLLAQLRTGAVAEGTGLVVAEKLVMSGEPLPLADFKKLTGWAVCGECAALLQGSPKNRLLVKRINRPVSRCSHWGRNLPLRSSSFCCDRADGHGQTYRLSNLVYGATSDARPGRNSYLSQQDYSDRSTVSKLASLLSMGQMHRPQYHHSDRAHRPIESVDSDRCR